MPITIDEAEDDAQLPDNTGRKYLHSSGRYRLSQWFRGCRMVFEEMVEGRWMEVPASVAHSNWPEYDWMEGD